MSLLGFFNGMPWQFAAAARLNPVQAALLQELGSAEALVTSDPGNAEGLLGHLAAFDAHPSLSTAANDILGLVLDEAGPEALQAALTALRTQVRSPDFARITASRPARGSAPLLASSAPGLAELPASADLPEIEAYLNRHLDSSAEIITRLTGHITWASPQRGSLAPSTEALLQEIELAQETQRQLRLRLRALTVSNADETAREVSAHYLRTRALDERIAGHEVLGSVHRSDMVDMGWELNATLPDEESPLPGLSGFLTGEEIGPVYHGRIELLLRRYITRLEAKKAGGIGDIRRQPFDSGAFAMAIGPSLDAAVVRFTLRFIHEVWSQDVPDYDAILAERRELTAEALRQRARRRILFPERHTIESPEADETLRRYLSRLGIEIDDELFVNVVGVRPDTIYNWGRERSGHSGMPYKPREIGHVMLLYRYVVEQAWRQERLRPRHGGVVPLPDPMELLRLAYGEWAEPFFNHTAAGEPWTVVVPVPADIFDLSYAEMHFGRVLDQLMRTRHLRAEIISQGLRQEGAAAGDEAEQDADEEGTAAFADVEMPDVADDNGPRGMAASTVRRYARGATLTHRRTHRIRDAFRRLLGDEIGDILDFFLEAKSIIDQVATVERPGGIASEPELPHATHWQVRLAATDSRLMDLSEVTPTLDPGRHPFRYLEGERDDFTLLFGELRACLDLGSGLALQDLTPTSQDLTPTFDILEREHLRLLSRLQYYRDHPEQTPFSAPRHFERFYREVLLFARTVRERMELKGTVTYQDLTIDYTVVAPRAGAVAIALDSAGRATITPDLLIPLMIGEGLAPREQQECLRFSLVARTLTARGDIMASDLPQLAAALLPGTEHAQRERYLTLYQRIAQLESAALEVSRLSATNPDLVALYARADQTHRKAEAIPAEALPAWLKERFREFCWNRFGIPPDNIADYLKVLSDYFEQNSGFAECYEAAAFEAAFAGVFGDNIQARGTLLEFLYYIGLQTAEPVQRELDTRPAPTLATPPGAPTPPDPPVRPTRVPDAPTYASRQLVLLEDFLATRELVAADRARFIPILAQFLPHYAEAVRTRSALGEEAIAATLRMIATERSRLLGAAPWDDDTLAALTAHAQALIASLAPLTQVIDGQARSAGDAATQDVARELLTQMALAPELEPWARLIPRALAGRVKDCGPGSGAFERSLKAMNPWMETARTNTLQQHDDLLALFDTELADLAAADREALVTKLVAAGQGLLPDLFRGIETREDWEALLTEQHFAMSLFCPKRRHELHEAWNRLFAPLPEPSPDKPEQAAPAKPPHQGSGKPASPRRGGRSGSGTDGTRPVRLPAPAWNPADYETLLSAEAGRALWSRVQTLAGVQGSEERHLLFYLTDTGIEVSPVSTQGAADARQVIEGTEDPAVLGAQFFFEDRSAPEGEEYAEIFPGQLRLVITVNDAVRRFTCWAAEATSEDPSYPDLQLAQALILFLPMATQAGTNVHALLGSFEQGLSRQGIRQALNRLVTERAGEIRRHLNYYRNLGPWRLTQLTQEELSLFAKQSDISQAIRVDKVLDILETQPGLPPRFTAPIREAIQALETNTDRSSATYRRFLDALLPLWPEATRLEEQRLRALTPEAFHDLAALPELVQITQADLAAFSRKRHQAPTASGNAPLAQFNKTMVAVLENPALEIAHRILWILFYPGLQSITVSSEARSTDLGPIAGRLRNLLQALAHPRADKDHHALAELLQCYREHRDEYLWRFKEGEGQPEFRWTADILPREMPPRFARSDEFPELEAIAYWEIDDYRRYLFLTAVIPRALGFFIVDADARGLWHYLILRPNQMILRRLPSGQAVPVGMRTVEGGELYFHPALNLETYRAQLGELPRGDQEGTVDSIGEPRRVRMEELEGAITTIPDYRAQNANALPHLRFLHRIFAEDQLRDIHPIAMLLFATALSKKDLQSDYLRHATPALALVTRLGKLQWGERELQRIRETFLSCYRRTRPGITEATAGTRFERYFGDPSP